ncbi:hypothetical protein G7046_g1795 [Stylonectria norvegica]|nr:hypothetical protein G7046_g1795 [Stylonectria norvegica]
MSDSTSFNYFLADVEASELETLSSILWGWTPCTICSNSRPCTSENCPQRRLRRLEPFFQYYKEATGSYVPESLMPGDIPALRCHGDLFDIIRLLQRNTGTRRVELTKTYFGTRASTSGQSCPPLDDQHRAFNLAVRVSLMVNTSIENYSGGLLESGTKPYVWRSDEALAQFLAATFPIREHPSLNEKSQTSIDIKGRLSAVNLKKVAGLSFFNLRRLALETLDSLQILFPLDPESQALLRSLVSKQSFDPDCLRFGSASYRREDEDDILYHYWGSRLMDLYDEIENPKPRGPLEIWMEQRSKSRHVMMATLAGVVIAIMLGIMGLIVGIFQAWVSYQAWKHPVTVASSYHCIEHIETPSYELESLPSLVHRELLSILELPNIKAHVSTSSVFYGQYTLDRGSNLRKRLPLTIAIGCAYFDAVTAPASFTSHFQETRSTQPVLQFIEG